MNLFLEGIWCRTKSQFDRYINKNNYDLIISYPDISIRLSKNDPDGEYPSDFFISLHTQKLIRNLILNSEKDSLNIAYMFKELNFESVNNLKIFLNGFNINLYYYLIIIENIKNPSKKILNSFNKIIQIEDD